jgi:iron complex outermembrane receptor protein
MRKNFPNRLNLIGAILFLWLQAIFSQTQYFELTGRVLNAENSEPVGNAVVFLVETNQYTTSSNDGTFYFANIKVHKFRIKITHLAFQEKLIDLNLLEQSSKNLIIYLIPKTINLSPVVISSNSKFSVVEEIQQFSSVLSGKELQRNLSQTLASTLKNEAGLSIRSMGPAPSRPVFRGLGQERVLISEDGIKTTDLSGSSPDHAVTLEPFQSERIEVLRGPKVLTNTLTSVGGVVNVVKNEIPFQIHNQLHVNAGGYYESANKGLLTGIQTEIPFNPFALRFEISRRKTDDLKTPVGYLKNSMSKNFNSNVGFSFVEDFGVIGSGFKIYNLNYGIPGGFVGAHPFGVNIDIQKQQINVISEFKLGSKLLDFRFSNVQYRHKEFEYNGLIGSEFAINTNSANLNFDHSKFSFFDEGVLGISFEHRDYNIGGYVFSPPSYSYNISAYVYENFKTERLNFEIGLRYSYDKVIPRKKRFSSRIGQIDERDFNNLSISGAILYQLSDVVFLGMNLSKSSRVPTIEELFSDGPHLAAYSYEVGNPQLKSESGYGTEFYVYHKFDKLNFNLNFFYNYFDYFIIPQNTGRINYQTFLPIYETRGVKAAQFGFDGSLDWRILENINFVNSISFVNGYFVKSKLPLPQIPPLKGELGLRYTLSNLSAGISVEWSATRKRVDEFEERTAGYAIVNLFTQYIFQTGHFVNNIGLSIENLFNKEYRNHLSRVKSILPEAGINIRIIYKLMI